MLTHYSSEYDCMPRGKRCLEVISRETIYAHFEWLNGWKETG